MKARCRPTKASSRLPKAPFAPLSALWAAAEAIVSHFQGARMKLKKLVITNFRGYKNKTTISFEDDLTAITGRNDAGKSTVLEALEIFFNNKTVKIDSGDRNVRSGSSETIIGCVFDELPEEIIVDEKYPTSFGGEYLLNKDGDIEISKTFSIQKTVSGPTVTIKCIHPSNKDRS
jgi:putative ATP-dependent endonuclease of OLD family